MKPQTQKINYKGDVILVEGFDDEKLIRKLLPSGLQKNIIQLGGYTYLATRLESIKLNTKSFQTDINSLLIIIDADDNFGNRKKNVVDLLNRNGLILSTTYKLGTIEWLNGINVGVFILPDNRNSGSLERLLLESVEHKNLLACTDNMISCRNSSNTPFQNLTQNQLDKVKFRLYMNTLVADYDFTYKDTFAAEIDYSHSCFDDLKLFVTTKSI